MIETNDQSDLIGRLESEVLAIRDRVTTDDLCLLFTKVEAAQRRLKEVKEQLEAFCIIWMPANKVGELRIGDEVKFVGDKSREKAKNMPVLVTALYEAVLGDFDAFCDCLSANAIKYGQARKVLGDKYRDHFETIVEVDLITEKPKKVLKSLNEHFVK